MAEVKEKPAKEIKGELHTLGELHGCDLATLSDPQVVAQYRRIIGAGAPGSRRRYRGKHQIIQFSLERRD